jgi:nitroreductase
MRPRRPVFAKDYILETAQLYRSVVKSYGVTKTESVKWSHDVLAEYFCVVHDEPVVLEAKSIFEDANTSEANDKHTTNQAVDSPQPPLSSETSETASKLTQPRRNSIKKPYQRDLSLDCKPTADELEQLAIRRRSCRWFLQKPVPRTLIDRAMIIGGYAPSACNRQPFEFRFYDEPDLLRSIAAIPGGTAGFHHNFPCVAVLLGHFSAFPFDRDRHVPYIDASLAAMGFQLGLEVQGVSSCCINWPDVAEKEKAISRLLGLQTDERVIMMMSIGYPDPTGMVPYSEKKALDEIRSYNKTC